MYIYIYLHILIYIYIYIYIYADKTSPKADMEVGGMGQFDHGDRCPDASVTMETAAQTHKYTFFHPERSVEQREATRSNGKRFIIV